MQAAAQDAPTDAQSAPVGADAGLLGALPPEMLTTLPALMSAIGPLLGGKGVADCKDDKTALLLALKERGMLQPIPYQQAEEQLRKQ